MAVLRTLLLAQIAIGGLSNGIKVNNEKAFLWKYVNESNQKVQLDGFTFNSSFVALPTVLSCYYELDRPPVEQLDAFMCTHLLFIGLCGTLPHGIGFTFPDQTAVDKIMSLKKVNPGLKILLTLTPYNDQMSEMVANQNLSRNAADSMTSFLMRNNFDGFDIDWEFPSWSDNAQSTDKNDLTSFLRLLRSNFDKQPKKLLLTMATSAPWTISEKAYDIPSLNKYLDYVNIMNYDFHKFYWYEPFTGFNAPLFPKRLEAYCTLWWVNEGMDRSKVLCGIPTYGRGYTLLTSFLHGVYAPATGTSTVGETLSYSSICNEQKGGGYTLEWDDEAKVPYMYKNRQWLNYEDERSVTLKAQWIRQQGLAGAMVFDLNSDDWCGSCGFNRFPLIKAINRTLFSSATEQSTTTASIPQSSPKGRPNSATPCISPHFSRTVIYCLTNLLILVLFVM